MSTACLALARGADPAIMHEHERTENRRIDPDKRAAGGRVSRLRRSRRKSQAAYGSVGTEHGGSARRLFVEDRGHVSVRPFEYGAVMVRRNLHLAAEGESARLDGCDRLFWRHPQFRCWSSRLIQDCRVFV